MVGVFVGLALVISTEPKKEVEDEIASIETVPLGLAVEPGG